MGAPVVEGGLGKPIAALSQRPSGARRGAELARSPIPDRPPIALTFLVRHNLRWLQRFNPLQTARVPGLLAAAAGVRQFAW